MKLSLAAIRICEKKYGKGAVLGFDRAIHITADSISEHEAQQAFDELSKSKWLEVREDGIRISPLGQHILNMLIDPDVFVEVDNQILQTSVLVYVRNAYYLLVIEENKGRAVSATDELAFNLLPSLKEVVGSFVYAMYREEGGDPQRADASSDHLRDILVTAKAWSRQRDTLTELVMGADYGSGDLLTRVIGHPYGGETAEDDQCNMSDFINHITLWMFDRLKENMESETVVRKEN